MQQQSKFLIFLSALLNFFRSFAVFCLCIATWAASPQANAQKSGTYLPEMAAAHAAARPVAAPAGPVRPRPQTQDPVPFIPATAAFDSNSTTSGCSDRKLALTERLVRSNPEWKPINTLNLDLLNQLIYTDEPTILEGIIVPAPPTIGPNAQSTSEVSEEDVPWNHFTHDFTVRVAPDLPYQHLLSSWVRFQGRTFTIADPSDPLQAALCAAGSLNGNVCTIPADKCDDGTMTDTCHNSDMEVEWENASLMNENGDSQRTWGAAPEFVWPGGGDRVWVMGRWIFDCGHTFVPDVAPEKEFVKFKTEIHPPRALVTFRLNHPALDSFPTPRPAAPNFLGPQSYLPVTGVPIILPPDVPNSGPTGVAVTEADIFVSGNGGQANDLCMIRASTDDNDCAVPHTFTVLPVNDRNYVFDVYPPGTDFSQTVGLGSFVVHPPTADASLQWRIVDHSSELPAHACGNSASNTCVTVDPIFCLIDASTPPPTQTETGCPAVPASPTRLRVILPFAGSNANFFAKSVLLGWDDVPSTSPLNPRIRTFQVTLHKFTIEDNGESFIHSGDWRVFVNVGGQYRYIDPYFDLNPDGSNKCDGESLTDNGDNDCFFFDGIPWIVSVQDGTPIHVAVGGWESDLADGVFCRQFPPGSDCDPFSVTGIGGLAQNNDRIGDYEFDLDSAHNYQWVDPNGNPISSHTTDETDDDENYTVEFRVQEIPSAAPPTSSPIQIGDPHFGNFVSSATPVLLASASPDAEGFQYRSYLQGGPLPVYPAAQPFPVHWTHAELPAGSQSVPVFLAGADGPNLLQFSAESFANLLEPRHTQTLILDNTPPVINIVQPQPTTYTHNATLTLDYSVSDGAGSGVGSVTPTMDGATSLPGGVGLQSGQQIRLLKELKLGTHTFRVSATDNVNNTAAVSLPFVIVVTPASIKDDVQQFLQDGSIKNSGLANSLLAKLNEAGDAQAAGQCSQAAQHYQVFIHELEVQSGKGVDADAAAIMIADAQYLIAHCP